MTDSDGAASALLSGGAPRGYAACAVPVGPAEDPPPAACWPPGREAARALLARAWPEWLFAAAAVLDAAAVGLEVDYPELCSHGDWILIAVAFNLLFTSELALRLVAYGSPGLLDAMHATQATITVLAWLELLASWAVDRGLLPAALGAVPVTFVQALRIMRASRAAGISEECRVMLRSFGNALTELGWVLALLLLFFFLAACAATVVIGPRVEDTPVAGEFASLGASMFTLLQLSLMEGWSGFVRPLLGKHWGWAMTLIAFIFLANMCLLNLLTAVVVERTCEARALEAEEERKKKEAEEREEIATLHAGLQEFSGEPAVSPQRFEEWLASGARAAAQSRLGFTAPFMRATFRLCDNEQTEGKVPLSSLKQVWEDAKTPLTMTNCVHIQHRLTSRLEHIEQLTSLVASAVLQLPAKQAAATKGAGGTAAE